MGHSSVIAALAALAVLAGCATPVQQTPLAAGGGAGLNAREITIAVHEKPDFAAMQSSTMGFTGGGLIAAAIMISAGNQLVADNGVEDPGLRMARGLSASLGQSYQTRLGAGTVPSKWEDPAELVRQNPRADLLLDVGTTGWSLNYFPTAWTRYRVMYSARMRLIDAKRGQVIAEGTCRRVPEETPDAPTYDQLVANKAARLKQEIDSAAEQCVRNWSTTLLAISDPNALLASVMPQKPPAAPAVAPVVATAAALGPFGTPLPENIAVQPPAADVSADVAAFSGVWAGRWTRGRTHTLVVERVEGRTAQLVYSWGQGRTADNPDPGFRRVAGEVASDGSLHVTMGNGADVIYRLAADRRALAGEWMRNGQRFEGTFQRRELPAN